MGDSEVFIEALRQGATATSAEAMEALHGKHWNTVNKLASRTGLLIVEMHPVTSILLLEPTPSDAIIGVDGQEAHDPATLAKLENEIYCATGIHCDVGHTEDLVRKPPRATSDDVYENVIHHDTFWLKKAGETLRRAERYHTDAGGHRRDIEIDARRLSTIRLGETLTNWQAGLSEDACRICAPVIESDAYQTLRYLRNRLSHPETFSEGFQDLFANDEKLNALTHALQTSIRGACANPEAKDALTSLQNSLSALSNQQSAGAQNSQELCGQACLFREMQAGRLLTKLSPYSKRRSIGDKNAVQLITHSNFICHGSKSTASDSLIASGTLSADHIATAMEELATFNQGASLFKELIHGGSGGSQESDRTPSQSIPPNLILDKEKLPLVNMIRLLERKPFASPDALGQALISDTAKSSSLNKKQAKALRRGFAEIETHSKGLTGFILTMQAYALHNPRLFLIGLGKEPNKENLAMASELIRQCREDMHPLLLRWVDGVIQSKVLASSVAAVGTIDKRTREYAIRYFDGELTSEGHREISRAMQKELENITDIPPLDFMDMMANVVSVLKTGQGTPEEFDERTNGLIGATLCRSKQRVPEGLRPFLAYVGAFAQKQKEGPIGDTAIVH